MLQPILLLLLARLMELIGLIQTLHLSQLSLKTGGLYLSKCLTLTSSSELAMEGFK